MLGGILFLSLLLGMENSIEGAQRLGPSRTPLFNLLKFMEMVSCIAKQPIKNEARDRKN